MSARVAPSTEPHARSGRLTLRTGAFGVVVLLAASACSSIEVATVAQGPGDGARATIERTDEETSSPRPTRRSKRRAVATPAVTPPTLSPRPDPEVREERGRALRTIRLKPRPRRGPFQMNLYRAGDFVHQQTKDWCVAGSAQTMLNIIETDRPDRSASFQRALYMKGRRLSPKARLGPIGVDLVGWARLLNNAGHGPYVVDASASRAAAIRKAAIALRTTGRPVGLAVWRGAHSWVMSGFKATADPAYTRDFEVTAVYIQDVWHPWVSTIWGASRPPDALVPVAALGEDFLRYRRPLFRHPGRDGRYLLVLPTLPKGTVAR